MRLKHLGLGAKFDRWRPGQTDAVWAIAAPSPRIVALNAPTGFGKTLAYIGAAVLTGLRTLVLTSTKALQNQLDRDFPGLLVDIRGQGNYRCDFDALTRLSKVTVAEGPCQIGARCDLKDNGCTYFDIRRLAMRAPLVVTNYAYHLYSNMYGDGLGAFDTIVCDEAHLAPKELSEALAIHIPHSLVQFGHLDEFLLHRDAAAWAEWFGRQRGTVLARLTEATERARYEPSVGVLRSVRRYRKLEQKLAAGTRIDSTWVMDRGKDGKGNPFVQWEPVWPAPYGESHLFLNTPKVVLVSATLRPKTLQMLGLPRQTVVEYPSPFPVRNRRVTALRGAPRIDSRTWNDHATRKKWRALIDAIIGARLDRQIVIQPNSYKYAQYILKYSAFAHLMVGHDRYTAAEVVRRFKKGKHQILVSPSVGTGFDFPYNECRCNIIAKVPFPDTRTPLMRARVEADPGYRDFYTATELEQRAGRGVRAEDDWCETFIIDGHFGWFYRKALKYFTDNFKEAVRWEDEPPPPPGEEGP